MVNFILNHKHITTEMAPGMTLLDFIRYGQNLKATKKGCREGNCGACTVREGRLVNGTMHYQTIVSCLMPLCNADGRHIVTVEGINIEKPSQLQRAIEHDGTQCGFCTPGFVVSLTAFLLPEELGIQKAIEVMDGNFCRCTGYKSIERAAQEICKLKSASENSNKVEWLVEKNYLPAYFTSIPERLSKIQKQSGYKKNGQVIIGILCHPQRHQSLQPISQYPV